MGKLSADFRLLAQDEYTVFLYSENDDITPFSVLVNAQTPLIFGDSSIHYDLLVPFSSGRLTQNSEGQFCVNENMPRPGR